MDFRTKDLKEILRIIEIKLVKLFFLNESEVFDIGQLINILFLQTAYFGCYTLVF